ncbi:MAG: CDP-glucose 4,6-dehydratase [Geobacteraceae bacterium]|nr:CDP-glucose 4,6-dehydratase [Geobacteraceae bacterium]
MEDMVANSVMTSTESEVTASFWRGKSVFLTGHTGFKGAWLSILLHSFGARVTGYALEPPTDPSFYALARVDRFLESIMGDVRDSDRLSQALSSSKPEIVLHLAAQPLVRESYLTPAATYAINVMGTVNILEAVRSCPTVRAVVNVTTDKCYENRELDSPFREDEPLGGYDPYSSSKACSELVTAAWRSSFFNPQNYEVHGVAIATARAGNVIGGGDWASERLIPDCIRALQNNVPIRIRNPQAIRPWQHVLEPISGYLSLAQKLYEHGCEYCSPWNFGPHGDDARSVEWIVKRLCEKWGNGARYELDMGGHPHEAGYLRLDITKARSRLGWRPRWNLEQALDATLDWVHAWLEGGDVLEKSM